MRSPYFYIIRANDSTVDQFNYSIYLKKTLLATYHAKRVIFEVKNKVDKLKWNNNE